MNLLRCPKCGLRWDWISPKPDEDANCPNCMERPVVDPEFPPCWMWLDAEEPQ